jgi:selenide,water dikinase
VSEIKLTAFSSSSGCGCKVAPAVLEEILSGLESRSFPQLLLGHEHKDDAAVYRLGPDQLLLATTDFFTPVVDDPYDFGRIAATNALSDIYAMGGTPIMALSILGWPTELLPAALATEVLRGAQEVCDAAGIALAGGHSIDSKEPIFGLAVNGLLSDSALRTNAMGKEGDVLYLTKPLGLGILATALKRGKLSTVDGYKFLEITTSLNKIGQTFGQWPFVHGLTDVTGFGLLGHLLELCDASKLGARIQLQQVPLIPGLQVYIDQFILPDQVYRNWNAYGSRVKGVEGPEFMYLCDPQTSGGLLVSVDPKACASFEQRMLEAGQACWNIGSLVAGNQIEVV